MRGLLIGENVQQRVGKDEQRRRVDAFRREDRPADQREVRAVNQRHAVEQKKLTGHGAKLIQTPRNPNKKSMAAGVWRR